MCHNKVGRDRKLCHTRQSWRARAGCTLDRGAREREFLSRQRIFCHNRLHPIVPLRQIFLYRDKLLTAMLSRQRILGHGISHVATMSPSHGRVGMPMLGAHGKQMRTTESSAVHDKARARDDRRTWGCARHGVARATGFCSRDRVLHATEAFCHDRDFSIATDLSSSQKIKNKNLTLEKWGVT